jgi:caffeyl-CoA reductase-Etf complex subunit CarE
MGRIDSGQLHLIERQRGAFRSGGEAYNRAVNVEKKVEVWVVIGLRDGEVEDASLELVAEGRGLADRLGATLAAVVLHDKAEHSVPALGRQGAPRVHLCDHPTLSHQQPDVCLPILEAAVRQREPRLILFPSDRVMRVLAARLAARLGVGLVSECTKLDIDGDGYLLVNRPVYAGRLSARVVCRSVPQIATFQPGYGKHAATPCEAEVVRLPVPTVAVPRSNIEKEVRDPPREMDLMSADVIVAGGRGVGGPDGFALLERLAQKLGGAVAASRAAVEAGWVPAHRQVGLSGKTVAPRLYVACGISGATHHVVGMKDAKSVIAINSDRSAPIFKIADVAVLGDVHEVIPRVLERLEDAGNREGEVQRALGSVQKGDAWV